MNRERQIDEIAKLMPRRNAQLARLLYRRSGNALPRGMTSILSALGEAPQRVTNLAEREGLSQPSATRMIERLEVQGLATRVRDPDDGRSVVVSITPKGRSELRRLSTRYATVFRRYLNAMNDDDLQALIAAGAALQALIDLLQQSADGSA